MPVKPEIVDWNIEKYLKAALLFHGQTFPKTHDLIELYDLCLAVVPELNISLEAISILSPYGVGVRYPGTANTLGEAREATEAMKQAREFLRKHLV